MLNSVGFHLIRPHFFFWPHLMGFIKKLFCGIFSEPNLVWSTLFVNCTRSGTCFTRYTRCTRCFTCFTCIIFCSNQLQLGKSWQRKFYSFLLFSFICRKQLVGGIYIDYSSPDRESFTQYYYFVTEQFRMPRRYALAWNYEPLNYRYWTLKCCTM